MVPTAPGLPLCSLASPFSLLPGIKPNLYSSHQPYRYIHLLSSTLPTASCCSAHMVHLSHFSLKQVPSQTAISFLFSMTLNDLTLMTCLALPVHFLFVSSSQTKQTICSPLKVSGSLFLLGLWTCSVHGLKDHLSLPPQPDVIAWPTPLLLISHPGRPSFQGTSSRKPSLTPGSQNRASVLSEQLMHSVLALISWY